MFCIIFLYSVETNYEKCTVQLGTNFEWTRESIVFEFPHRHCCQYQFISSNIDMKFLSAEFKRFFLLCTKKSIARLISLNTRKDPNVDMNYPFYSNNNINRNLALYANCFLEMIERSRIEFRFESGTIRANYSTNGTEEKPNGHNGSKTGTLSAFENIILRPYYMVLRTSESDISRLFHSIKKLY